MHAILTTVGTDGDVNPYIGLAGVLRKRGHRVTLAISERYRAVAARLDLHLEPLAGLEEFDRILKNPDFWHPLKGPWVVARWGARLIGRQYEMLADLCRDPEALLIASPGVVAARVVQDKIGMPLTNLILQPWMIKSVSAPPVMPAGMTLPRFAPGALGALYWRLVDGVGDVLIGPSLNRLRRSLGLAPVRRMFDWWLSPELVIGMFPPWYGPPQADWRKGIELCGFPLFDGQIHDGLDPQLQAFCAAGDAPVTFTFGTGMMHAGELFGAAVEACRSLGIRGVLLTRHTAQLPQVLPENVVRCDFAPFSDLFPRCSAVVHHGGVGTVASAFAAGMPQVIIPNGYDQLDNALRVKRLGAGQFLKRRNADFRQLAQSIRGVLDVETRNRCAELAARFAGKIALEDAADCVERLQQDGITRN